MEYDDRASAVGSRTISGTAPSPYESCMVREVGRHEKRRLPCRPGLESSIQVNEQGLEGSLDGRQRRIHQIRFPRFLTLLDAIIVISPVVRLPLAILHDRHIH